MSELQVAFWRNPQVRRDGVRIASLHPDKPLTPLSHLAEAAGAYREALTLRQQIDPPYLTVEPLPRVALAQGDSSGALAHAQQALGYLSAHPALGGTCEPLRVWLTCYRVLRASRDPRADEMLEEAQRMLQERAGKVDEYGLQRPYLVNVPYHREIVSE